MDFEILKRNISNYNTDNLNAILKAYEYAKRFKRKISIF